jgi:hypothetical protein
VVPRFKAWKDATETVLATAASVTEVEVRAALQPFVERAADTAKSRAGVESVNAGLLSALADHAPTYEECRALAEGYFTVTVLGEIDDAKLPTLDNIRVMVKNMGLATSGGLGFA